MHVCLRWERLRLYLCLTVCLPWSSLANWLGCPWNSLESHLKVVAKTPWETAGGWGEVMKLRMAPLRLLSLGVPQTTMSHRTGREESLWDKEGKPVFPLCPSGALCWQYWTSASCGFGRDGPRVGWCFRACTLQSLRCATWLWGFGGSGQEGSIFLSFSSTASAL